MASKEFQMLFKMQASLGGDFTRTMQTAGKQMQTVQQEVKALAQAHSDIGAYQKQQSAVEKTQRKLEDLQKQYDNIQREYEETGESSSELANKMIDKKRQIDQTSAKLEQQTEKLDQMGSALQEAGVDTGNLTEEQDRLEREMDEAGEQMQKFSEKGVSGFEALGSALIAAGVLEGLNKMKEAYMECVKVSADFDQAMSQVAATMGVSNSEVQDLAAYAKEMGATTAFSASEAAGGLNILAMAGLSATEQMAALPTVLDLAAAGAMDLQSASTYVTGAVKGFSDSMDNAGFYADLMAKGATMANTNVAQLGEALVTAAATAASYGQAADSVTLSLLRLADQNVVGSEAATKLNRAMADVYMATDQAKETLDELGVSIYDLTTGDARDFNDIVDELSEKLSGYSMEQQNAYKNTIFTTNGLQAFNKMTVSTSEKVEEFYSGLQNASGSATQQAATQLDNLNGAMTIFGSAMEGLKITIGEQFQPMMTSVVKTASDVITQVNEFAKRNPVLVKSVIALTAELGAFLGIYTAYIAAKKLWTKVSQMETVAKIAETIAQKGFNAALLECPITWIAAGVAALTVGVIALTNAQSAASQELNGLTTASREEYEALQAKKAEYEEAVELYGEHSEQAIKLSWDVDRLTESYENNKQTIADLQEQYANERDEISETVSGYYERMDAIQDQNTKIHVLTSRMQELASQSSLTAGEESELKAILDELNATVPNLSLNFEDLAGNQGDFVAVITKWADAKANADKYKETIESLPDLINKQRAAEQTLADSEAKLAAAKEKMAAADTGAFAQQEAHYGILAHLIPGYSEWARARDEVNKFSAEVEENRGALEEAKGAYSDAQAVLEEYANETLGTTEQERALNGAIQETFTQVDELVQKYNEAYTAAYDSISGQFDIWDEAAEVSSTSVSTITSNLESQNRYWTEYNSNLQNLQGRTGEIEGLSDVIASFADGSEESVAAIAGMAAASDSDLKAMVEQWKAVQEVQKKTSESLADVITDFTNQMDDLQNNLEQDVANMDLSDEARASGRNTLNGYLEGLNSVYDTVVARYRQLASDITAALSSAGAGATVNVPGHAAGTNSAAPGYALVGEEGPELVKFRGGEQVIPAHKTAEMLSGGNVSVTVSPTVNLAGGSSGSDASIVADVIVEHVLDALDEAGINASRRAYR